MSCLAVDTSQHRHMHDIMLGHQWRRPQRLAMTPAVQRHSCACFCTVHTFAGLHISSRLSVLQVSLLTNGEWPMLHKLELYVPCGTSASIQQITAAPWPQLEELVVKKKFP